MPVLLTLTEGWGMDGTGGSGRPAVGRGVDTSFATTLPSNAFPRDIPWRSDGRRSHAFTPPCINSFQQLLNTRLITVLHSGDGKM